MSDQSKPRLPIWLIVSLMANALLIGLMIGGGLGQRKAQPNMHVAGDERALMRGLDQSLPSEQRREVRRAFRKAFSDSRTEREALRDARRQIGRLLSADPYDEAAVQAGFADMRAAEAAMKARMHNILSEQLGVLDAEQRKSLMRDFNRSEGGPRRGNGERRGSGPGPDGGPR